MDEVSSSVDLQTDLGLNAVQVGGDEVAWRFVCLPPSTSCQIQLEVVRRVDDPEEGVRIRTWGGNIAARAMLRYLVAGQVAQAKAVAGDLLETATQLFREKVQSPEGATVAGYLLLRLHESARLREWPDRFASLFDWLPDAHVIHAWQLLRERGAPGRDLARRRLLDAADAGVPRYTEGLRLLFEGLRLFGGADPDDHLVSNAVQAIRGYAEACDWSAPQTTYWGERPEEPALGRRVGQPDEWNGVVEFRLGI
jgi:hypothetical protein